MTLDPDSMPLPSIPVGPLPLPLFLVSSLPPYYTPPSPQPDPYSTNYAHFHFGVRGRYLPSGSPPMPIFRGPVSRAVSELSKPKAADNFIFDGATLLRWNAREVGRGLQHAWTQGDGRSAASSGTIPYSFFQKVFYLTLCPTTHPSPPLSRT